MISVTLRSFYLYFLRSAFVMAKVSSDSELIPKLFTIHFPNTNYCCSCTVSAGSDTSPTGRTSKRKFLQLPIKVIFMAEIADEEQRDTLTQHYHDFRRATQRFEKELYDPEECEEILESEKSKALNSFKQHLGNNPEVMKELQLLEAKIDILIETLKESNNTRFWFVQNILDECMDSALTHYKNNVEKRFENVSSLTQEEFKDLQRTLESECLGMFDHKVTLTKDLPPPEVQISRHQLRKEIQEMAENSERRFKEGLLIRVKTAVLESEEKAKKIMLEKINRYTSQFDIVSSRDFHAELGKIRKSTIKQIENEMFIENQNTEPVIFQIVDKLEANLHDYGANYWSESLVFSNQEGNSRIREKIQQLKESYSQNLYAKRAHQRKIFVQAERSSVVAEFVGSFTFSDEEDEENFKEQLEQELTKVEQELGVKDDGNGDPLSVTELTNEQYL